MGEEVSVLGDGSRKGWVEGRRGNHERAGEDYKWEKFSLATNMFNFLSLLTSEGFCGNAAGLHLHESWLLSSSTNDETREGMPDSLSTYYKSCWEVWSLFSFPGCAPGTHILHFFHLFMTFPWPQTYAMSPGEMEAKSLFKLTCVAGNSPIVLPCSAAPPQENEEYKCTDRYEKERNMNTPLCFHTHCLLSTEVLYHRERWSFAMCMSSPVSYKQALWMSLLRPVLIQSNLSVSETPEIRVLFFFLSEAGSKEQGW